MWIWFDHDIHTAPSNITKTFKCYMFPMISVISLHVQTAPSEIMNKPRSGIARYSMDSYLDSNQVSSKCSLELKRFLFDLFPIESLSNSMRIQPGAVGLIIQLILN